MAPAQSPADFFDVVVVGYGPVGQVLANQLASGGHSVAVIERRAGLYPRPRAVHLDHEIHRVLDRLGVLEHLGDAIVAMKSYDWRGADDELILAIDSAALSASGWAEGHLFYQPALEAALDARARAAPSVTLMQGWRATAVTHDESMGTVMVERDGEQRRVAGRYVIGADGANSLVRTATGFALDDLGFSEHWLVIDVRLEAPGIADRLHAQLGDSTQWCNPDRPHMSARVGARHRRWEFMLLPGERPADFADVATVWAMLARWITPDEGVLERHVVYEFTSRLSTGMRQGCVLLAGDAAHTMPPFVGQGLCSGIRDATNLAWKLDLVLRGVTGEALLATYEPERRTQNRQTIEVSLRMGKVSCTLSADVARDRDVAFRDGRNPPPERLPGLLEGLLARTCDGPSDPLAGSLGVQGRIRLGSRSGLADDVLGEGFCLIGLCGDLEASLDPRGREVLERLDARLLCLDPNVPGAAADIDGRLTAWLLAARVAAVLVRPDCYVFGAVTDLDELPTLLADLEEQLCLTRADEAVA